MSECAFGRFHAGLTQMELNYLYEKQYCGYFRHVLFPEIYVLGDINSISQYPRNAMNGITNANI